MSEAGWTDKRPMSPHLQVWRWHSTMLGSILHRMTGIGNYLGAMLVVAWLFAAASGPEAYMTYTSILASPLGLLVLFGFTVSICYHALNGVRHLVLDSGEGLTPRIASLTATAVLVLSIVAAVAIWVFAGLIPGVSLTGAA